MTAAGRHRRAGADLRPQRSLWTSGRGGPSLRGMDIRPIVDGYAVAPQIDPGDMPEVAAAGYACVICNRPDEENPPHRSMARMAEAARSAGLRFEALPVTHATLADAAGRQREIVDSAGGPVLAYCASGTRSTILWALGQAGDRPAEEIVAAGAQAGYDLAPIRAALGG